MTEPTHLSLVKCQAAVIALHAELDLTFFFFTDFSGGLKPEINTTGCLQVGEVAGE